ncbi:MAG: hypothetical protein JWM87_189 [Candidatus Eremiobacteraeota bacterium]|nr:hypothetical protein [Candidatus Eremiobacteraeota bacterium]
MKRGLRAFIAAAFVASPAIAHAAPATFATTYVSSAVPRGQTGFDAGVDVSQGRYVRLTASGTIALPGYSACRATTAEGCAAVSSPSRSAPDAATGSLIAAFVSRSGMLLTAWSPVGLAAYVAVPPDAARMVLRINGTTGYEFGAFRVVADVVGSADGAADSAVRDATYYRRGFPGTRTLPSQLPTRSDVQYAMRRFGFGDTPANVTAVSNSGVAAWIAQQLSPETIDDSALNTYVEPIPLYGTGPSTKDGYDNYDAILQRRIVQREIASKRQLLEKMTLHWLEHFAVSQDKVNSAAAMIRYEETVRTDALGNFKQLVSDVSVEPAMLLWLDNNNNDGSNVVQNPPNENFARELMQLYVLGTTQLNPDGSAVVDVAGNALQTYTDTDVKQVAQALTGFQRTASPNPGKVDPRTVEGVKFYPARHAKGPFTIMGQTVTDTGDPTIVGKVIASIASNPATAPFEVKELLQRFVTETPSPGYVARIVPVWNANADDPKQLAKVMAAIAADPEFYAGKGTMIKEPIEFAVDAIRGLNGAQATPFTPAMQTPYRSVNTVLGAMQQQQWYPPSVFSFYRPGEKESLLTNSLLLSRWSDGASLSNATRMTTLCPTCDVNLDLTSLTALAGGSDAQSAAGYVLDALVDGGTPQLRGLLQNYLANNVHALTPGAVWIVLTSPEYEVN